jgi:hypothetical protein
VGSSVDSIDVSCSIPAALGSLDSNGRSCLVVIGAMAMWTQDAVPIASSRLSRSLGERRHLIGHPPEVGHPSNLEHDVAHLEMFDSSRLSG